jgi:hypothetical protein
MELILINNAKKGKQILDGTNEHTCYNLLKQNNSYVGNVDEDKVLLVRAGGTLEIHGSKKLPWTKLGNTAPKLENSPGFKAVVKVCE